MYVFRTEKPYKEAKLLDVFTSAVVLLYRSGPVFDVDSLLSRTLPRKPNNMNLYDRKLNIERRLLSLNSVRAIHFADRVKAVTQLRLF